VTSANRRAASPRSRREKHPGPTYIRDQEKSSFTAILESLMARLPGAFASALVDPEGETVDYAGEIDPFEIRISAAHWRIVLDHVPRPLGSVRSLVVRSARRSYIVYGLPEGYALVVLLGKRAGFTASSRAFFETQRELAREAGWSLSREAQHWYPVRVECDRNRRPVMLRRAPVESSPVEILGTVASGLGARESGYRVRVDSGAELTLVREPGGRWYAEEAPVETESIPAPPRGESKK
jgi:hypothetical protein